jgi:hypothetical protein
MAIFLRWLVVCLAIAGLWSTQPAPAWSAEHTMSDPNLEHAGDHLVTTHHLVSTQDPMAQALFDSALESFYAFDLDQANHFFHLAAAQDPTLAMAQWGIALSTSPDVNQPIDPTQAQLAYEAITQARQLAQQSPTTALEKAYITALAKRYSNNPQADFKALLKNYLQSLNRTVVKHYPDDLDAATLYAEGLMDLQGWELWDSEGNPLGKATTIASTLEAVLQKDSDHVGANHYYIHAIEASSHPEAITLSAQRLKSHASASPHLQKVVESVLETGRVEY